MAEPTGPSGRVPVPDPTELTDRAIRVALERMHEYVDGALAVRDERIRSVEELTKAGLAHRTALSEVQHAAIGTRVQAVADTSTVALSAARELAQAVEQSNQKAIDKSERSTAETITKNQELSDSRLVSLSKTVDGLREAVARIEAAKLGAKEDRSGLYAGLAALVALIGLGLTIAAVLATRAAPVLVNGTP